MLRKVFAAALTSGALILGSSVSPAHASAPIAVANPIGRGSAAPVAPLNTQQYLVEFECAAAAVGAISSTRVDYCNLYANGSYVAGTGSLSLPGNASATAALAATPIGAQLMVCWSVSAQPVLTAPISSTGCTIVNSVIAA